MPSPQYVFPDDIAAADSDTQSVFDDETPPPYSATNELDLVDLAAEEVEAPPPYSMTSSPTRPESDENMQKLPRIKTVQVLTYSLTHSLTQFSQSSSKPPDRMLLLFNALVQRKNNDAGWLGKSLTRTHSIEFTHSLTQGPTINLHD